MSEPPDTFSDLLTTYAAATQGEALDQRSLRRRVLEANPLRRPRPARKLAWVLPLAATFVASAALAASQPAIRQALRAGLSALFGSSPTGQPAPSARPPRSSVPPPSQRPAPVAASSGNEPLSPTDLPALAPTPSARPSPSRLGSAPAIVLEDAPEPAPNPEVASYRQAHRTHFDGAPPSVALAAWDKYLAAYPAGSFAPDARFNRALCLLRLGRNADARAALAPFAQAPAGGYRQAEAASLLRSLDDAAEKN